MGQRRCRLQRNNPTDSTLRISGSADNLISVLDKAKPVELIEARRYYDDQRNRIAGMAKIAAGTLHRLISTSAAVGAFCALSPNNSEKINYIALDRAVRVYCRHLPANYKIPAYPLAREKAMQMLGGVYPPDLLRGRKTLSFYYNTMDPRQNHHRHITVDGHVFSAWVHKRVNMKEVYFRPSDYDAIERQITEIAVDRDELPTTIQALIWLVWRRLNGVQVDPQLKFDFARIYGEDLCVYAS